ncbi:protein jagged-1b-like [Anneissia japonica]|uniref:protein jagged-1b-like n=1 Tax=Anneissia japonica TaxID=1529436 RepID=UPI001425648F|nr:protein jagged-1b-like [Anneissia japonica]
MWFYPGIWSRLGGGVEHSSRLGLPSFALVFFLQVFLVANLPKACVGTSKFQVRIEYIHNRNGELANGQCCGASSADSQCLEQCRTCFYICGDVYRASYQPGSSCIIGESTTSILGNNSFTIPDTEGAVASFDITYAWLIDYSLIIEVRNWDVATNTCREGQSSLIERSFFHNVIKPNASWSSTINHRNVNNNGIMFGYKLRVICDEYYYGEDCNKFCRPDNNFRHFSCDMFGNKVCHEGWIGRNCNEAVCKTGCNLLRANCTNSPGECRCAHGWQGEFCNICVVHPMCENAWCSAPFECFCELGWGGRYCNQFLDPCGSDEELCHNGGTCLNNQSVSDGYDCHCVKGFFGPSCEFAQRPCATDPCQNGGTCQESGDEFNCFCTLGWEGETCTEDINDCANQPCVNGGLCVDLVNGFQCICLEQWQGPLCQLDKNECLGSPCQNAFTCRNAQGDYFCDCHPGWTGKDCDTNQNDCIGRCENGATCMDLVNSFLCVCPSGFVGTECELDVDECISQPCKNGGTCVDLVDSYRCDCTPGYSGSHCQVDVDPCHPNPCKHGAMCYNLDRDYFCDCIGGYQGRNCSEPRQLCETPTCQVIDSCTISIASNATSGTMHVIPSNICGLHGQCISQTNGRFTCVCEQGYTGYYCHENINDCNSNPCMNHGTCMDGVNSFQCLCREGWEGEYCQHDVNECLLNPCQNNGTCVDLPADFACLCQAGWKGKTCSSRQSHCEVVTCYNDGTCHDNGDTFECLCSQGWEGSICHLRNDDPCDSNPCLNSGTCVSQDASYQCICKEGYEGQLCESNVNDCNPQPCYNNGRCVDGLNWFRCECADGFAGPDCRINLDDCATNPCAFGSTCIDEIASFRCHCPSGLRGPTCNIVIGVGPDPAQSCVVNRREYEHSAEWVEDCNACSCQDGQVSCTQVWCGPQHCEVDNPTNSTSKGVACPEDVICEPTDVQNCFTPPCGLWGVCQMTGLQATPSPTYNCQPSQDFPSSANCGRLILTFDKTKLPSGISVDDVCLLFRYSAALFVSDNVGPVVLLCSELPPDSIAVAVSLPEVKEANSTVALINAIVDYLELPGTSNLVLSAVVTIQKLTYSLQSSQNNQFTQNLWMFTLLVVLLLSVILLLFVFYRVYQRHRRKQVPREDEEDTSPSEPKNNQQQAAIKRYHNQLFTNQRAAGSSKAATSGDASRTPSTKYTHSEKHVEETHTKMHC